jgi:hypothetical protein
VDSSPSPELRPIVLLISHERSGSHFLASYIRALANNRTVDEVCNEGAVDPATNPMSFFGFRHKRAQQNPEFGLRRNPAVVSRLLDEYFAFVAASGEGANTTIDVKYGHVHNFEVGWWPVLRRPFLFEYVKKNEIRIIHLSRWNTLETVISGYVAESRKVWHSIGDNPDAQLSDAITVNPRRLADQIARLNEQKSSFFRWTRELRCLTISYEELVHPDIGVEARARIASFLDADPLTGFQSSYRKVTPGMEMVVRNWEEVQEFCRDHQLAHYLVPIGTARG